MAIESLKLAQVCDIVWDHSHNTQKRRFNKCKEVYQCFTYAGGSVYNNTSTVS